MKKYSFLTLLIFMLLFSCNQPFFNSDMKPPTGEMGEILVVVDNEVWIGPAGDSLRRLLEAPVFGLPQDESQFIIKQIEPASFTDNNKLHRNVLQVIMDSEDGSAKIQVHQSPWSNTQRVVSLIAPTEEKLVQLVQYKKEIILKEFLDAEKKRVLTLFNTNKNGKITEKLTKSFKIDLSIPAGYAIVEQKSNFMWIQQYNQGIRQMVFIYSLPYTGKAPLNREFVLREREKMTTLYVPGSYEGSHMMIEPLLDPGYKEYSMNGKMTYELRGLWRMSEGTEGSVAMGGPFVSICQLDTVHQRVIMIDGSTYAPEKKKRNPMLELEAVLSSLKIL
ncbi:MAG: DUF4837 family protein [Bacteroidales bacterium]|nr:DUF4837 family protein [Bacteroidales bacterium]